MKISEILKANQRGAAFEFFPPKSDKGRTGLARTVKALKAYQPLYASMTCGAAGKAQEATQEGVSLLLAQEGLEVMPHLTCLNLTPQSLRSLLDDYRAKGIQNVMLLRGDPPQEAKDFSFSGQDFSYALDLVKAVREYGHFDVGVAVYPEGHIEAASLDEDLEYARGKIDAGADFAVTQMFFDNRHYYRLLERMQKLGVNIPVLPGILPLTDIARIKQFASICRATVPQDIEATLASLSSDPEAQEQAGVEFTIKQCRDLVKNGAGKIHFFTLNKPEVIKTILEAVL